MSFHQSLDVNCSGGDLRGQGSLLWKAVPREGLSSEL